MCQSPLLFQWTDRIFLHFNLEECSKKKNFPPTIVTCNVRKVLPTVKGVLEF